jgi:hypothetical protein
MLPIKQEKNNPPLATNSAQSRNGLSSSNLNLRDPESA